MGFGCPICSEKLERLPAEAAQRNGGQQTEGDVNISTTPCGHIFHTYCIQKWLSGPNGANKQCPCCRKAVPGLRVLPLYPNGYEDSILDDSMSQASCDHSSFNVTISSLRKQLSELQFRAKGTEELLEIQKVAVVDLRKKYETERLKCDKFMFQAKQNESYKDYAELQERKCKELTEDLKKFKIIECLVKGLKEPVDEEMQSFPPTRDSIKALIEIKEVLKEEIQNISKKFDDSKQDQETVRKERLAIQNKYVKLKKDFQELQKVYNSSYESPDRSHASRDVQNIMQENQTRTPLLMSSKVLRKDYKKGPEREEIDEDVPLIQPFGRTKLKKIRSQTNVDSSQGSKLPVGLPPNSQNKYRDCALGLKHKRSLYPFEMLTSSSTLPKKPKSDLDDRILHMKKSVVTISDDDSLNRSLEDLGGVAKSSTDKNFRKFASTNCVVKGAVEEPRPCSSKSITGGVFTKSSSTTTLVTRPSAMNMKLSKLTACNLSPITPTLSNLEDTINLSDSDDDVSQIPLRGNIPGMRVTPLNRPITKRYGLTKIEGAKDKK